jgi:GAF domain-containing protein
MKMKALRMKKLIAWLEIYELDSSNSKNTVVLLRNMLILLIIASFGLAIYLIAINEGLLQVASIFIYMAIVISAMYLLLRGDILFSRLVIPFGTFIFITILLIQGNGLHDSSVIGFAGTIILSNLALGRRGVLLVGTLSILAVTGIGLAEMTGYLQNKYSVNTDVTNILVISTILLSITALEWIILGRVRDSLILTRKSEAAQLKANEELRVLQSSLELRIAERTVDLKNRTVELEGASIILQKRATQQQAVAEVARAIASVQNLSDLLPRIAFLISQEFKYYHVGIFLVDENFENAVLSATSSEGGKQMLARGHKLKIGEVGIVGYVASTGEPRIALDTGKDLFHFNNPDLPKTRSELALPLKIKENVIGVLDVQSDQQDIFGSDDIEVLSILADQASIAIQNARQFEETNRALSEAQQVYRQFIKQEWHQFSKNASISGYRLSNTGVVPMGEGELPTTSKDYFSTPIILRGQNLGAFTITNPAQLGLDIDDLDIIKAIADRVAISLESARLLEESQKRVVKEQTISNISVKLNSAVDINNILITSVEELGQILPGAEIIIQLESGVNKDI